MAEYARFSFDRMGEMPHVDRIYVERTSLLQVWQTRLKVTKTLMTALLKILSSV